MNSKPFKLIVYVSLALVAFAGNSVLCRLALGAGAIDVSSFTAIRLVSGAITLIVVSLLTQKTSSTQSNDSWYSALMLFIYALAFSYAYVSLDTGIGALVLFGSVQISMILYGVIKGNKLHFSEWFGIVLAFSGFVYLLMPILTTPSLMGFILMAIAGIGWAFYTLAGRGSNNPMRDTTYNFVRTIPFVLVWTLFNLDSIQISQKGVLLAILSGALTSAIGYMIWYKALKNLSITQAAVVQLLVPIIAAMGGVLFANELITLRLLGSSLLVLGGIFIVVIGNWYWKPNR